MTRQRSGNTQRMMRRYGDGGEHVERVERSVLDLVDGVQLAEAALRRRVNELLDYGYSYQTVADWLGMSRKTFYRRYVEVQQKLF